MHVYDLVAGLKRATLRRITRHRFESFGNGSSFDPTTSRISGHEHISIGRNVFIGPFAAISTDGVSVRIGNDTVIGPGFYLMAGDHLINTPGVAHREGRRGTNLPINIGMNVWIGARTTILKGITIGDGAVVAAGSVVTRNVDPMAVVAGVPARFLRWRFDEESQTVHRRFLDNSLR
jgi:acetyltransferase-like isoleucine patch superfamily enzyme